MTPQTSFQDSDPLKRIQYKLPHLSKTHKKVANYILDHFDRATFATSARLSRECGVSESSVIRLATTLGYSGYSEFQRALQDLLKSQLSLSQRLELTSEEDRCATAILHRVMTKEEEGVRRALVSLDKNNFQMAVDLLSNAERVFLFGSRSSYALVYFFGLELRWIRDNIFVMNGQATEFDALTTLTDRDVFLAISLPRYLRSTTRALELAWCKGIPTIAITDTLTSPLVPYATVPLLVNSEIFSYSDNIVPIACTITALLNAVGAATQPHSNELLTRHEETWDFFDMYLR